MVIFRWHGDILYQNRNSVCAGNHGTPLPISCWSCSAVPPTIRRQKKEAAWPGLAWPVGEAKASWRGRSWLEQPTRPRPTNRHRRPLTRPQYEKLFKVIMLRHTAIHMLAKLLLLVKIPQETADVYSSFMADVIWVRGDGNFHFTSASAILFSFFAQPRDITCTCPSFARFFLAVQLYYNTHSVLHK